MAPGFEPTYVESKPTRDSMFCMLDKFMVLCGTFVAFAKFRMSSVLCARIPFASKNLLF